MSRRDQLQKLIAQHYSNLNKLREQASTFGPGYVPLPLRNQINDTEATLEELQTELAELESSGEGNPSPEPPTTIQSRWSNWLLVGGGLLLLLGIVGVCITGVIIFAVFGYRTNESTPTIAKAIQVAVSSPTLATFTPQTAETPQVVVDATQAIQTAEAATTVTTAQTVQEVEPTPTPIPRTLTFTSSSTEIATLAPTREQKSTKLPTNTPVPSTNTPTPTPITAVESINTPTFTLTPPDTATATSTPLPTNPPTNTATQTPEVYIIGLSPENEKCIQEDVPDLDSGGHQGEYGFSQITGNGFVWQSDKPNITTSRLICHYELSNPIRSATIYMGRGELKIDPPINRSLIELRVYPGKIDTNTLLQPEIPPGEILRKLYATDESGRGSYSQESDSISTLDSELQQITVLVVLVDGWSARSVEISIDDLQFRPTY